MKEEFRKEDFIDYINNLWISHGIEVNNILLDISKGHIFKSEFVMEITTTFIVSGGFNVIKHIEKFVDDYDTMGFYETYDKLYLLSMTDNDIDGFRVRIRAASNEGCVDENIIKDIKLLLNKSFPVL